MLTQDMLGVRPSYEGLVIDPRLPSTLGDMSPPAQLPGRHDIHIRNPERLPQGVVHLTLDGREISGNTLPLPTPGRHYKVEVNLLPPPDLKSLLPLSTLAGVLLAQGSS